MSRVRSADDIGFSGKADKGARETVGEICLGQKIKGCED